MSVQMLGTKIRTTTPRMVASRAVHRRRHRGHTVALGVVSCDVLLLRCRRVDVCGYGGERSGENRVRGANMDDCDYGGGVRDETEEIDVVERCSGKRNEAEGHIEMQTR